MIHRECGVLKTSYAADMALYPLPIAKWTVAILAVLFFAVIPLALHEYYLSIANLVWIAVIGALGLNILVGYTGQVSIGHGAFMSVGAYTAANLATRLDSPWPVNLLAGGLMAAAVGAVVGIPSLRIKGLYLAIATLAGQLIIEWTINHVTFISGGVQASIEVPRPRLGAMSSIETLLGAPEPKRDYILREPRHGDFGWIVSRHAELYAKEYGWVEPFEGLCAQIVADYVNNYDPAKERCWIAELNGENVGCVMLVKDKEPGVARLRLLLVDPKGRGLGIGKALTGECIKFARTAGYQKMTLWTHSVLTAARAIYEKAGFTLTGSEKRKSWSKDVVAEYWDLEL